MIENITTLKNQLSMLPALHIKLHVPEGGMVLPVLGAEIFLPQIGNEFRTCGKNDVLVTALIGSIS